MKIQLLTIAALAAFAAGCGADPAAPVYLINAGDYTTSDIVFSKDDCNYKTAGVSDTTGVSQLTIAVDATTKTVTFTKLSPSNPPKGVKDGNNFTAKTEYDYDNSPNPPCVETITREVSGTMTAENRFDGTFTYSSKIKSGTCTAAQLLYTTLPCTSTATFKASKK